MPTLRILRALSLLAAASTLACPATDGAVGTEPSNPASTGSAQQSAPASAATPTPPAASSKPMQPWAVVDDVEPLDLPAPVAGVAAKPAGCLPLTRKLALPAGGAKPGMCIQGTGYWGAGALLVKEMRGEDPGYRMLVPFSFVTDKNPSLGWPAWNALSTILVDRGWIPADLIARAVKEPVDPMFERPMPLRATIQKAPAHITSLWKQLDALQIRMGWPPYGREQLPFIVSAPLPGAG